MRKLYESIVNHKKTVIVAFVMAMIVSAVCSTMVNVNYDINDYLPDGTASTVALDTMNEEYDMSIPNARVMVSNLTVAQALEMKQKLSEIEGVEDVTLLDDVVDTDVSFHFCAFVRFPVYTHTLFPFFTCPFCTSR